MNSGVMPHHTTQLWPYILHILILPWLSGSCSHSLALLGAIFRQTFSVLPPAFLSFFGLFFELIFLLVGCRNPLFSFLRGRRCRRKVKARKGSKADKTKRRKIVYTSSKGALPRFLRDDIFFCLALSPLLLPRLRVSPRM